MIVRINGRGPYIEVSTSAARESLSQNEELLFLGERGRSHSVGSGLVRYGDLVTDDIFPGSFTGEMSGTCAVQPVDQGTTSLRTARSSPVKSPHLGPLGADGLADL